MKWFRGVFLIGVLLLMTSIMVVASLGRVPAQQDDGSSSIMMSIATPVQLQSRAPDATGTEQVPFDRQAESDAIATTTPLVDSSASTTVIPSVTTLPRGTTVTTPAAAASIPPTSTPVPMAVVEAPLRLRVPVLGVDSAVQWVGLDSEGRMGVPDNYSDVAWYELGPRPGMPGNAVIAGHLDSTSGPAIFYKLEDLRPGDEIIVVAHDGEEVRFIVEETAVYDADDAPLSRIFGPDDRARLNLITCDGVFDRSSRSYDKRLIVFAVAADA